MEALLLAAATLTVLIIGVPVPWALGGVAVLAALLGTIAGSFDPALLQVLPGRLFALFTNDYLLAIPPFILIGVIVERTGLAESLVADLARLTGGTAKSLCLAVIIAGTLLAALTGIVGASVIALALIAATPLLRAGVPAATVSGLICASGTLGQLIPPSILLLILADIMQNANSEAQWALGNFAPDPVTAVDLFAGALIPGVLLALCYAGWIATRRGLKIEIPLTKTGGGASSLSVAGLALVLLGLIFSGITTIIEAASMGVLGAIAVGWHRNLAAIWGPIIERALVLAATIFAILVGATVWSLVFRGFGGDLWINALLTQMPGGLLGSMILVMAVIFVAGFFLEVMEILLIIVPLTAPALITLGADPLWLSIMIAINLQASFLTPPMGVSLFYFRSAAPDAITTLDIYKGVIPFVLLQLAVLVIVGLAPALATGFPALLFN